MGIIKYAKSIYRCLHSNRFNVNEGGRHREKTLLLLQYDNVNIVRVNHIEITRIIKTSNSSILYLFNVMWKNIIYTVEAAVRFACKFQLLITERFYNCN